MKRKETDVYRDLWDVSGGKLEDDDTLYQAIEREIREETGLVLKKILLTLTTSKFQGTAQDMPIIMRNTYICIATGDVVLSEEHSEFRWIEASELDQFPFPQDTDLQEALKRFQLLISKITLDEELTKVY